MLHGLSEYRSVLIWESMQHYGFHVTSKRWELLFCCVLTLTGVCGGREFLITVSAPPRSGHLPWWVRLVKPWLESTSTISDIPLLLPLPLCFHSYKFWSCCQRRTSDFNEFQRQVGCATGDHLWIKVVTPLNMMCALTSVQKWGAIHTVIVCVMSDVSLYYFISTGKGCD